MKMELRITRSELAYRPDIDGLRAVSILLVVGYHAQPWLIPGGFIGVDVFFVISGFLITRIILGEIKAGAFSLSKFYARRVRRIFPALIVVLVAAYLIGWFLLLPEAFSLLGESIAASVAFAANLFLLGQSGYFAADAAENPLLHLWSLGVEEQFYIFWPLTLMLFGAARRQSWMIAIAAVSFGVSLMIFFGYKEWSFYSPIPRAWELLVGGIVASRYVDRIETERKGFFQRDDIMAIIGILAIVGAALGLHKDSLFPGVYALLPVLGAALLIISPNSFVNRILLSNPPMVLVGKISYPLYLWHWPILVYLAVLRNDNPNFLEIWLAVVVAVILSWLTYRFVELPVRRQPKAVPRLAFGLMAIGLAGIVTFAATGFAGRFTPEIREIARLPALGNAGFDHSCFLEFAGSRFGPECIEPGDKPLVFLWGDSTAAALYPGLKAAEKNIPFRLAHFTASACPPIAAGGSNARCDAANGIAMGFLRSSKPAIVLLHAMWNEKTNLGRLKATIAEIRSVAPNARIVIVGPVPLWKRTLPNSLVTLYRLQRVVADRIRSGVSGPSIDTRIEAFSREAGVEFISAWRVLCNEDGCLTRVGPAAKDVVTTDIIHLSDAGSAFLIAAIAKDLFRQR
jgi:peptidoglycan/LPS O-acetylase OafA/YrhL